VWDSSLQDETDKNDSFAINEGQVARERECVCVCVKEREKEKGRQTEGQIKTKKNDSEKR